MGEETPGPGAYMPLSTFAKAASGASYNPGSSTTSSTASSIRAPKGMPTALFRSRSPQRGKVGNQLTPGPGTHTPIFSAQEPNPNRNAAPHMAAKGKRFAHGALGWETIVANNTEKVGPGSYETHKFQTLAQDTAHAVSMGSRQNPGFGIGSPQHHLPHETALNEDEEVPGPGKYSLPDPSLYLKARTSPNKGPTAAFRMPMARKKQTQMHFDFSSAHTTSQKAPRDVPSRKSKKKQESGRDMVHV